MTGPTPPSLPTLHFPEAISPFCELAERTYPLLPCARGLFLQDMFPDVERRAPAADSDRRQDSRFPWAVAAVLGMRILSTCSGNSRLVASRYLGESSGVSPVVGMKARILALRDIVWLNYFRPEGIPGTRPSRRGRVVLRMSHFRTHPTLPSTVSEFFSCSHSDWPGCLWAVSKGPKRGGRPQRLVAS